MPKLLNFRFPEVIYFFINFDNTEFTVKDPLKYFFLFPDGIAGRSWVKQGFNKICLCKVFNFYPLNFPPLKDDIAITLKV